VSELGEVIRRMGLHVSVLDADKRAWKTALARGLSSETTKFAVLKRAMRELRGSGLGVSSNVYVFSFGSFFCKSTRIQY
jgi:hypothetical protein